MNLLLDTHAWLWFVLGDSRLSETAHQHIRDPNHVKYVSPASYWEISIKIGLGKYALEGDYRAFMRKAIEGNGFRVLHITPSHTCRVAELPLHHRDPFDRLLIAQAMDEAMSVVSDDGNFSKYQIDVIW